MKIEAIVDAILDQSASRAIQRRALMALSALCASEGGIEPNPSFDAWAKDSFLEDGVAINPRAAAHCVVDYRRTVVFIRGVYAGLTEAVERFLDEPIRVLYAGCGPYATLLLPLLARFDAARLDITLLDYHQESLDSVARLIETFSYENYDIKLLRADACDYRHCRDLHLIIAETMQKSLEQEPQLAVTANLAPQLEEGGIFIPAKIEVELCLADIDSEQALFERTGTIDVGSLVGSGLRVPIATILTLLPGEASALEGSALRNEHSGSPELPPTLINIPQVQPGDELDAFLFTRVQVFAEHHLVEYEAEITLPLRCFGLGALRTGDRLKASYELGRYPKFNVVKV